MGELGLLGLGLLLLVVSAVAIAVAAGSVFLARRLLHQPVSPTHNSTLSPFLTCIALVYGALLGFTIVVSWEQFSSADANVAAEASTLTTMYRQTVGMPADQQGRMRELLRTYTRAVEGREWDIQEDEKPSDAARRAVTDMYRVVGSQPPDVASSPLTGEFLGQLTVLTSQRNQRILEAEPRIPGLLWAGLLFGGVLVVGISGFLYLESMRGHLILSCAVALLLGLLLCTVFWLDHPFGNLLGVTSAPFEHALEVFNAVDRGT
jgi:Protein of unknown function (DUF4239)